jgi:hypothetical protein
VRTFSFWRVATGNSCAVIGQILCNLNNLTPSLLKFAVGQDPEVAQFCSHTILSVAVQPFVGPRPLFQFFNPIHSR